MLRWITTPFPNAISPYLVLGQSGTSVAKSTSIHIAISGFTLWPQIIAPLLPTSSWTEATPHTWILSFSEEDNFFRTWLIIYTPTLSSNPFDEILVSDKYIMFDFQATTSPMEIFFFTSSGDNPVSIHKVCNSMFLFLSSGAIKCIGFLPIIPNNSSPDEVRITTCDPGIQ